MDKEPFFSVLLPAKGRPHLVRDALLSILEQSFTDFEVIVSNNGAESTVKDAIAENLSDPRVRYLEQPRVLSMPEHWEMLSRLANGRYLTVLTDRSVLKQSALEKIADIHRRGGAEASVISWAWDVYFEKYSILQPFSEAGATVNILDSVPLALESLQPRARFPLALPRGLNSSVSRDLVEKIRNLNGAAFSPMSPDYTFAYACLLCHPQITYINKALMISQGLDVSNGGKAYRGDANDYLATLDLDELFRYSPIKEPFVENLIAEDFFSACHRYDRLDVLKKFDMSNLYLRCYLELSKKRADSILTARELVGFEQSLEVALAQESAMVIARVAAFCDQRHGLSAHLWRVLKKGAKRIEWLKPFLLRCRGGKRFSSVLAASGHRLR